MNKLYFLLCLIAVPVFAEMGPKSVCVEEKKILLTEFIPIDFDRGRNIVGLDQVEPVKKKIQEFMIKEANVTVTDIQVLSSSSKTPHYKVINGKKKIDPESDEKNLNLATERAMFVVKSLEDFKKQSTYRDVKFDVQSKLSGPEFNPKDLNDRFVTKMTPGYKERVKALYESHKKDFEETALKKTDADLLNEQEFGNLYQAKFKPFLGFKLTIQGYKKDELKCLTPGTGPDKKNSSSKQ